MHQGGNGKAADQIDEKGAVRKRATEPLCGPDSDQVAGAGAGCSREANPEELNYDPQNLPVYTKDDDARTDPRNACADYIRCLSSRTLCSPGTRAVKAAAIHSQASRWFFRVTFSAPSFAAFPK